MLSRPEVVLTRFLACAKLAPGNVHLPEKTVQSADLAQVPTPLQYSECLVPFSEPRADHRLVVQNDRLQDSGPHGRCGRLGQGLKLLRVGLVKLRQTFPLLPGGRFRPRGQECSGGPDHGAIAQHLTLQDGLLVVDRCPHADQGTTGNERDTEAKEQPRRTRRIRNELQRSLHFSHHFHPVPFVLDSS